jgi:hypothetical protein
MGNSNRQEYGQWGSGVLYFVSIWIIPRTRRTTNSEEMRPDQKCNIALPP